MKRRYIIVLIAFALLGIVSSPLYAADFAPIFPKQGAKMVSPPNFTWAVGDYDLFVLYLLLPIPGYWYQPIPIPQGKSYFLMPESWWDYMTMNGWGLWFVLGMNTTTWDYSVTPWQYFQKVTDCVVDFPDPRLEEIIRLRIDKPVNPILASDVQPLSYLDLRRDPPITDISGLEYCMNLRTLDLGSQDVNDLSPLAGLVYLERLDLWQNQISDASPLAGLANLNDLDLTTTGITDIGPLSHRVGLVTLRLGDNQISDLSPLAGLVALEELDLWQNQISDVSPLAGLANLNDLDLSRNQINDPSSLSGLPNLRKLGLWQNEMSDLTPLSGFVQLEWVGLHDNGISDISPLGGLTNLRALTLSKNEISNIGPLSGLANLDSIALSRNQINDISPLEGLLNLEWLGLDNNQISDIRPLVDNPGIGAWDLIELVNNPLSVESCYYYIPELESRNVEVWHNCR